MRRSTSRGRGARSSSRCGTCRRFADELAELAGGPRSSRALWVTMFNEPNTTRRTLAEYEQVYRSLHRLLVERGVRDRIRFMGGDLTRSEHGRLPGRVAAVHGEPHGRPARCVVGARLLGLLGHRTRSTSGSSREVRGDRELDSGRAAPARSTSRSSASAASSTFEGEVELRSGLLAGWNRMSATETSRVPAGLVQHPRRAARLLGHGQVGRVSGQVRRGHTGFSSLGPGAEGWPARPVYNALQLLTRTTRATRRTASSTSCRPGASDDRRSW